MKPKCSWQYMECWQTWRPALYALRNCSPSSPSSSVASWSQSPDLVSEILSPSVGHNRDRERKCQTMSRHLSSVKRRAASESTLALSSSVLIRWSAKIILLLSVKDRSNIIWYWRRQTPIVMSLLILTILSLLSCLMSSSLEMCPNMFWTSTQVWAFFLNTKFYTCTGQSVFVGAGRGLLSFQPPPPPLPPPLLPPLLPPLPLFLPSQPILSSERDCQILECVQENNAESVMYFCRYLWP